MGANQFSLKRNTFLSYTSQQPYRHKNEETTDANLDCVFYSNLLSFWGFSGLALHLSLPPWIKHIPEVSWHILDLVRPFSRWTWCVDIFATAHLLGREFLSVSRVIGVILSGKTMSNDIRRSPLFVGSLD